MMEESINTQITPEKFEIEDGHEIANSTEGLVIAKAVPEIPSRYLRARIPSCHDFCKYGIHHSSEAKPWSAARKKFITWQRKTKVPEEIVISVAGTKKSTSSLNPSPTSKFGKPNGSVVIRDQSSMDGTVPSEKIVPPVEEANVSIDHGLIDIKKEQSAQPSLPVQECSNSPTMEVVKSKITFASGSKNTSESRIKQKRTSLTGHRRITVSPGSQLSPEHYVKKSSSITSKTAKNMKGMANLKIQKNVEEVKPESTNNDNLEEKILHVDEPTPDDKSMESTLPCDPTGPSSVSPSSSEDKSLKQDSEQIGESGSPLSSKKSLRHAGHGIRPTKSLAPSPQSSQIKGKRHLQNTVAASSSLSSLSHSVSSRRISRHADQGIHPTKSLASSPLASGIKVMRRSKNTMPNASSSSSSLSRLTLSWTSRHADHGLCPTKSLAPSPLSSGVKVRRHKQHTMHGSPLSSSSPSQPKSPISPSNSCLGKQNGATSKSNKTGKHYQGENVKVGYKIRPKQSAIVGTGNKVIPTHKLSFRKGRVIELQPQNNNIPQRLKFRPVRLLSDVERERNDSRRMTSRWKEVDKGESLDAKVKSETVVSPQVQVLERSKRRNFRRTAVDGNKVDGSASGGEQVVLRHQNLLGKKVTRRLYNNVIEETATKLAELRQSKVKALVGAFETVISLDSPCVEATPS